MRRVGIVIAVILALIFVVQDIVEFVVKQNWGYYSDVPHLILYALGVAILVGLVIFTYERLPSRGQNVTLSVFIALVATIAGLACLDSLYDAIWFFSIIPGSKIFWQNLLFSATLGGISACLWWVLWRRIRNRRGPGVESAKDVHQGSEGDD